jgi:pyrroloquinoline quinone biosynthesis protein B
LKVRILGAAAGGGSPQWNCNCAVCRDVRAGNGDGSARTQSSIAVRGENGPWLLVNASPDLRQQLQRFPVDFGDELRRTPFAGVLLTDAEIDHTAGLLLMRESSIPLQIYSTEPVREALTSHYPVLRMLERYCGVLWTRIEPGEPLTVGGTLTVEAFPTGGDPPLYVGDALPDLHSVGLTFADGDTGGVLTYAPGVDELREDIASRMAGSDCVLVDGTFWERDELVALGLAQRDALAMGHMPLSGPGGSLERLRQLPGRVVLVHVNNTNPILLEHSAERAAVATSGVEVGVDGMEVVL